MILHSSQQEKDETLKMTISAWWHSRSIPVQKFFFGYLFFGLKSSYIVYTKPIEEIVHSHGLRIQSYADDCQIYGTFTDSEQHEAEKNIKQCQKAIISWLSVNYLKLNEDKTQVMVSNGTDNYQFGTRFYLGDSLLEIVNETKLLGCIITSDLSWWPNTNLITQKAYQRLQIVRELYEFNVPLCDLPTLTLFMWDKYWN